MTRMSSKMFEALQTLELYQDDCGPFDPDDYVDGRFGALNRRSLEALVARKLVEKDAFGRYAILDSGRAVLGE